MLGWLHSSRYEDEEWQESSKLRSRSFWQDSKLKTKEESRQIKSVNHVGASAPRPLIKRAVSAHAQPASQRLRLRSNGKVINPKAKEDCCYGR